jgi:hypothetical protein
LGRESHVREVFVLEAVLAVESLSQDHETGCRVDHSDWETNDSGDGFVV